MRGGVGPAPRGRTWVPAQREGVTSGQRGGGERRPFPTTTTTTTTRRAEERSSGCGAGALRGPGGAGGVSLSPEGSESSCKGGFCEQGAARVDP